MSRRRYPLDLTEIRNKFLVKSDDLDPLLRQGIEIDVTSASGCS